jgi:hypothetical protein
VNRPTETGVGVEPVSTETWGEEMGEVDKARHEAAKEGA